MSVSRPRVCLISHAYLEKRYRGKLNFLGREVDLTLVSPDEFPFAYGQYHAEFPEAVDYNVKVYRCRFPLGLKTSTRWILSSRDFGFRQSPPDIIHVENEASSFSLLQALIYRKRYAPRARVVIFVWANQKLFGLKGLILNRLSLQMRPGVDFYIAGNSEARDLLIEDGIPEQKIAVLPLIGLDTKYFSPVSSGDRDALRSSLGFVPQNLVIGFVGRLVEDKGVLDLLQAFQKLKKEMNSDRLRLLFVGDGLLKTVLESQGRDVIVVSPGASEKVLPYYRMMDALVLPSRTLPHWKEQFGLVMAEAMACGLPVIGSSSGAIPEVLGNRDQIFPEGDVGMLAKRIKDMLSSAAKREEVGRHGLERIRSNYSDEEIARRTLSIYSQVLECPTPAA
jgi:glycosyltransferase involved in cell wall biosynthesis